MAEKKTETKPLSVFETLNAINVNEHTEKKNNLTYLSWAWAWAELKKNYPDSFYTIYENADGLFYHTDGKTAWVKTGVTVEGLELLEFLPVMDYKNQSITLDKLTSYNVNTAIQRSLTKAVARHGLGLYIYAGEDLPNSGNSNPEDDPEAAEREARANNPIDAEQVKILQDEITALEIDLDKFCKAFETIKLEDIKVCQFEECIKLLTKKRNIVAKKKAEEDAKKPIESASFTDMFDDSLSSNSDLDYAEMLGDDPVKDGNK
jgi:hypothetical protein